MVAEKPMVSVVIANYNGADFVYACFKSLFAADYSDFEVIFVDNASTDRSLEMVRLSYGKDPRVKIIANSKGLGPARARNIGIVNSRGKYLVFLDNDTEVGPSWLKELVKVLESNSRIGAAQSKLLLFDKQTIDTCGHYLSISGFPYEVGSGEKDSGQYQDIFEIFGARSAGMIARREALEKSGYFDEDYFMHGEETDLCWRIWLAGYRIVFVPDSVVYHKKGGTLNPVSRYLIFYQGSKNCTKTLLKNLGLKRMLFILPVHIMGWLALSLAVSFKGRFHDASGIFKGLCWDLLNLGKIIKQRKQIQEKRALSDKELWAVMMGPRNPLELFKKGLSWIGRS